jgi:asparagine synthetase B (glutamine-hydrolysing)
MARVVCMCRRGVETARETESETRTRVERLDRRLAPDNISTRPPLVWSENGVTTAVLNPTDAHKRKGASVCLGFLADAAGDWWRPRAAAPDGSYALFRAGADAVELLNDVVGSRTVWYSHTDDLFVASTSQRAIVALLGSFEPNPEVAAWMLSAGQLGPGRSYDRRIRVVPPNSRVLLDRAKWRLTVTETPNDFAAAKRSRDEHAQGLVRAIEKVFSALDFDPRRWVLPLSGGVDSRAILYWLKSRDGLRAVTWGVRSSLEDKGTDAYVAAQVARHYRLDHRFFETNVSEEPADTVFTRFLSVGEGRTDAVAGYTDGFKIWKSLFDENAAGVLRGDECFGLRGAVHTPFDARRYVSCLLLSDYGNLPGSLVCDLPQTLPDHLARRGGESILGWRDRLYYDYRMPYAMAALTDLKVPYVEVVNPFLARSIVDYMRTVPDSLRLRKNLFVEIANGLGPDIPYAERAAIDTSLGVFRTKPVGEMIRDELGSAVASSLFPKSVLEFIGANARYRAQQSAERPETHAKYAIPRAVRKPLGELTAKPRAILRDRFKKPALDPNIMAFRAFLASRMQRILAADARALEDTHNEGRHS